jgi:uncharacterized protein (TIGR00369 family)
VEALLEEQHASRYSVTVFGADKPELLARLNHVMVKGIPWNAALGFVVEDVAEGLSLIRLPYRPELTGNPATGALHGGVVTSLLDAACGQAVFLKVQRMARVATLDLRIDYLKPATPPRDVRARAECYKVTRQVAFVRALAYHDDLADPIAAAAGTFMIFEDARTPMVKVVPGGG